MENRLANNGNCERLYFLGLQSHADSDCSHEIKRHLLLWRKVLTNLDSILKSRHITLTTKVHLVRAIVFPAIMYVCERWTINKAEHQIIDNFGLWCWRRLLRVPWTARRSNQSILKDISPEYSLDRQSWGWKSSTLASWCKELTHWKRPWCWERLREGAERDDRGWDGWMASLTQWTWVWVNCKSRWWKGRPGVLQSWGRKELDMRDWTKSNWTEISLAVLLEHSQNLKLRIKNDQLQTDTRKNFRMVIRAVLFKGIIPGRPV